ncbi:NAD(P)/FAD-dependent oxidoreductase [Kaarinaea lacus]
MRIAIIGTGIAGNVAAYKLHKQHDVTVFEANNYVGGHTHTHHIELDNEEHNIDTGFIVFNQWTYPNFIELLDELGVDSQPSNMSFSVKCEKTGLEYNGTTLNSLFAQRRNLVKPSFYRMIRDILRFNQQARQLLRQKETGITLGDYLREQGYSKEFINQYIVPMGAAIWSSAPDQMMDFPAYFFIRFFNNHGMLNIDDRPTWHVIKNGSRNYVDKMIAGFRERIKLKTPVEWIRRFDTHVLVKPVGMEAISFDSVFIACHSNQALKLLNDPTREEKEILGAIPYQRNEAVLHTDHRALPRRKLAWAAWNYHILKKNKDRVALTYNMNILQSLQSKHTFCVTLNNSEIIDPNKILKRLEYDHPVFTLEGMKAQQRQQEINGPRRTYYCGAYWRNGFHEDGVVSALNALKHFERTQADEKLYLHRAS